MIGRRSNVLKVTQFVAEEKTELPTGKGPQQIRTHQYLVV